MHHDDAYEAAALERFIAKIDVQSPGCWIWTAGRTVGGYGQFRHHKHNLAHRFSWDSLVGPIPDGNVVDHLCRVRRCVNPDHLELVTQRENLRRSNYVSPTYCRRQHARTPENTDRQGRCRKCSSIRSMASTKRQRDRRENRPPGGVVTTTGGVTTWQMDPGLAASVAAALRAEGSLTQWADALSLSSHQSPSVTTRKEKQ